MKIKKPKRLVSLFLAALMCIAYLIGISTKAYAAEEINDAYPVAFPRDGDAHYDAEWGHGSLTFMNGWKVNSNRYMTLIAMGSYEGNICYCIEVGVHIDQGDNLTKRGEDFWDNYPSSYNHTISPDEIKLFIGRIFQYGYTGKISASWRSQNEGGDKLAHAVATQLLIWETVIGERDENFNKVSTGGKDAVLDQISTNHPLYDKIMSYHNSIAASVQKHTKLPSFLAKTPGSAQNIELKWDGSKYTATLTDSNNVLSGYSFKCEISERFCSGEKKETISVLLIQPGKYPKPVEIKDSLEAMQTLVGGDIEEYMPFEDEAAIICNEEGKINGLPLNRAIYAEEEVDMRYGEMAQKFREAEKNGKHLNGYIVFTEDSFTEKYPLESRSYIVSSDNKAYRPNMSGYSIFGTSLDGTDKNVRLDAYMAAEKGGKDGWKIERCYLTLHGKVDSLYLKQRFFPNTAKIPLNNERSNNGAIQVSSQKRRQVDG